MPRYFTYRRQIKLKPGERIDFRRGKGYFVIPAPRKVIPTKLPSLIAPSTRPSSMFSGDGVFCTSDTDTARGYQADWVAVQMDPEGDHTPGVVQGQLCYWQARPTLAVMQKAQSRGVPFIAQSESEGEFSMALMLARECPLTVPHALIGKVDHEWSEPLRELAVVQGWDLILEWYWNNDPSYDEPNADGYPLFRNVCFGTFQSETIPGRRIYVDEYRAIWRGPFSIWATESATGRDRTEFNT